MSLRPQNQPDKPPTPPTGLKWVFRICITIFLLPFLGVGLSLVAGGGFAGSRGGLLAGFGAFGVVVGLAFLAIPVLMLFVIWTSDFKQPAKFDRTPIEPPENPTQHTASPMRSCNYCKRPRPATEPTCPACGAS